MNFLKSKQNQGCFYCSNMKQNISTLMLIRQSSLKKKFKNCPMMLIDISSKVSSPLKRSITGRLFEFLFSLEMFFFCQSDGPTCCKSKSRPYAEAYLTCRCTTCDCTCSGTTGSSSTQIARCKKSATTVTLPEYRY